jgi:hypothetical protein
MARLVNRTTEAGLREYLLEEAISFRDLFGRMSPACWKKLSKIVDQLVGGEAVRLHAFELPEGHPARAGYGPNADLLLTVDDRLVLFEDYAEQPQHL